MLRRLITLIFASGYRQTWLRREAASFSTTREFDLWEEIQDVNFACRLTPVLLWGISGEGDVFALT